MKKKNANSSIYVYPAIITPEDNGKFNIRFPDIENCFTYGEDLEDGMIMAEDVLAILLNTEDSLELKL